MEMVFGVFYAVIYVLLCKMFVEIFGEKRHAAGSGYRYGMFICLMVLVYILSIAFADNLMLKEALIIVCGAICMGLCFCLKISKAVILVLLYQGMGMAMDYASIMVMSQCFSAVTMERLSDPFINLILGALSQGFLFCFILLLRKRFVKNSSEALTAAEWVKFSVFPMFTICTLAALLADFKIPEGSRQKNILICIAFGLLLMNIIVFSLINDILKREMLLREERLLSERIKNETGMYRAISENYDKQRKREHEYKNQMALIAALARDNKVEELNRYLEEYNQKILADVKLIDTGNVIVNAILNSKYQEAVEKGMVFTVKINDLSGLKIKDEDIVLILSNLLNNAIEAGEKCREAVIRVKFVKENNQVILSVVNTVSKEPLVLGDKFITDKTENRDMHGAGVENIRETVEKYGGSCVIKYDSNSFRFAILIPDFSNSVK